VKYNRLHNETLSIKVSNRSGIHWTDLVEELSREMIMLNTVSGATSRAARDKKLLARRRLELFFEATFEHQPTFHAVCIFDQRGLTDIQKGVCTMLQVPTGISNSISRQYSDLDGSGPWDN
jgi:hypothetical protein